MVCYLLMNLMMYSLLKKIDLPPVKDVDHAIDLVSNVDES